MLLVNFYKRRLFSFFYRVLKWDFRFLIDDGRQPGARILQFLNAHRRRSTGERTSSRPPQNVDDSTGDTDLLAFIGPLVT